MACFLAASVPSLANETSGTTTPPPTNILAQCAFSTSEAVAPAARVCRSMFDELRWRMILGTTLVAHMAKAWWLSVSVLGSSIAMASIAWSASVFVSSSLSSTRSANVSTTLPTPPAERAAPEMQALRKATGCTPESHEERLPLMIVDSSAMRDSSESDARTASGFPDPRTPMLCRM